MKETCKISAHCLWQAIRHPKTPIILNPQGPQSPIPWWGSIAVIVIGIISWVFSTVYGIRGLDEAARAMVYIPLGNIFGMSIRLK